MFPDLQRLLKLQHLATVIADARAGIAAHPQRLADAESRLTDATRALDAARQRLKDSQDARRAAEKDAAVYQGRLTKFKDQLSAVKTNREFTAMQHEIATAQAELGTAEEKVLERMMEADALASDVAQAEANLAETRRQIDAEKKTLDEEIVSFEAALGEATAARAVLIKDLEPRLVATFEHVAKVRKGIALSSATRDGLCSACHVRLRPQVFQLVRQNDSIIQCDSCQRILYYVPPPPPVEHPVTHRS